MRYCLRTLVILLAVLPPILAWLWWRWHAEPENPLIQPTPSEVLRVDHDPNRSLPPTPPIKRISNLDTTPTTPRLIGPAMWHNLKGFPSAGR